MPQKLRFEMLNFDNNLENVFPFTKETTEAHSTDWIQKEAPFLPVRIPPPAHSTSTHISLPQFSAVVQFSYEENRDYLYYRAAIWPDTN